MKVRSPRSLERQRRRTHAPRPRTHAAFWRSGLANEQDGCISERAVAGATAFHAMTFQASLLLLSSRGKYAMKLCALNRELEFVPIKLVLHKSGLTNVFAMKNNKTVVETLANKKYSRLLPEVCRQYPNALNEKLGEFLYRLKMNGDMFYLRFLNEYGDNTYCDFAVAEPSKPKGLYCFVIGDGVRYIGRSHDPFEKRFNQGYGHLSPKNCYRDGQATNCHLNSLIAQHWAQIACYVCPLENDNEIDALERALIRRLQPEWNIVLNR